MEFEELKIEVPMGTEETTILPTVPERIYENDAETFAIGFDVTSKEAEERRLRRARRFGIKEEEKDLAKEEEIDEILVLPDNLPGYKETEEIRPDSLLVYGVDEMSTKDIFKYFDDCAPGSVEWVDDFSCVVVWDDEFSAKKVYATKGKLPTKPETDCTEQTIEDKLTNDTSGKKWRIGPKNIKNNHLYFRYAVKTDRKLPGAAKHSMYYLIHGNPNKKQYFPGHKKGLISNSRKRKIEREKQFVEQAVKSAGEPAVQIIDELDDEEEEEMDVDDEANEPAVKVLLSEDGIKKHQNAVRMCLYADDRSGDNKSRPRTKDRLGPRDSREYINRKRLERQGLEKKEFFTNPDKEYEGEEPSRNLPDLRHKLKRGQGFSIKDKPALCIEIREEKDTDT